MKKKIGYTTVRLVAVTQILALTLLAACGSGLSANACHATGDAANPYEEVTVNTPELVEEHLGHANDIFPVPEGGCPTSLVEVVDGNVTICHATGSETNPFEEITVSVNGLNGHGGHEGDIIPVPEDGCPASVVVGDDALTVCHATGDSVPPYEALVVDTVELLNEHLEQHPNDFTPVPLSGCPESLVVVSDGQITMCHATGDATTPYEEVTVSVDGLDGHGEHEGDVFPISEEEGCPESPVETSNGKITICHATSSKKNPYVMITISVNGLNGHDKHEGDIIPAPAGGCPTTAP